MSTIYDLSPEYIEQTEKRMQPGVLSGIGFLGSGERLTSVIERDERTLEKIRITYKQIADRLESIIGKAKRLEQLAQRGHISNHLSLVENVYKVSEFASFGFQQCPFLNSSGKPCQHATSCDYEIENVGTGIQLDFSELIIHLVREHHFFEGSVAYRLEPEKVIKSLEIQSGQDYSPVYVTEKIWRREQGTTQNYAELERGEKLAYQTAVNSAEQVIKLSDNTCIYFWNGICVTVSDTDYSLSKELLVAEGCWIDKTIERGVWVYKPQKNTYVEL